MLVDMIISLSLSLSDWSIESTIVQLIQRFYDPDRGRILLDGKDIRTLNVAWLRSHIGIVNQEPILFHGSIEDNIRLGISNITDQQIQTAAKMANAHDFIMEFPEVFSIGFFSREREIFSHTCIYRIIRQHHVTN